MRSQLRPSAQNLLSNAILVLLEILNKLLSQRTNTILIRLHITLPSLARIKNLVRNTIASLWNGEVEDGEVFELGVL